MAGGVVFLTVGVTLRGAGAFFAADSLAAGSLTADSFTAGFFTVTGSVLTAAGFGSVLTAAGVGSVRISPGSGLPSTTMARSSISSAASPRQFRTVCSPCSATFS